MKFHIINIADCLIFATHRSEMTGWFLWRTNLCRKNSRTKKNWLASPCKHIRIERTNWQMQLNESKKSKRIQEKVVCIEENWSIFLRRNWQSIHKDRNRDRSTSNACVYNEMKNPRVIWIHLSLIFSLSFHSICTICHTIYTRLCVRLWWGHDDWWTGNYLMHNYVHNAKETHLPTRLKSAQFPIHTYFTSFLATLSIFFFIFIHPPELR